jgi:hypothetical protein
MKQLKSGFLCAPPPTFICPNLKTASIPPFQGGYILHAKRYSAKGDHIPFFCIKAFKKVLMLKLIFLSQYKK